MDEKKIGYGYTNNKQHRNYTSKNVKFRIRRIMTKQRMVSFTYNQRYAINTKKNKNFKST